MLLIFAVYVEVKGLLPPCSNGLDRHGTGSAYSVYLLKLRTRQGSISGICERDMRQLQVLSSCAVRSLYESVF